MSGDTAIKILAVDDNDEALFTLEHMLERAGYDVVTAANGSEALQIARAESPDLILSDVVMPGLDGYQLARQVKADPLLRYTPVVLLTSKDGLDDIIHGLEEGADDYVRKPFQQEELLARLKATMRTRRLYQELERTVSANEELRSRVGERYSFQRIIGRSDSMQELYSLIEKVSRSDVPVLVVGESGTGKELVASAIHYSSNRKDQPLVVQNCSAFSEHLLESELFGHLRGSFTGAVRDKKGLFEASDGGTFFLDELGEMSLPLQAKLLRVLEDGSFTPVGSTTTKKVDVRILAATNRNLEEMIAEGTFREDLYYRLNVVTISLPPLRDRRGDIPLLLDQFLRDVAKPEEEVKQISDDALRLLCAFDWPGNVRELRNEVERMTLMAGEEPVITPQHLSPKLLGASSPASRPGTGAFETTGTLKEANAELERRMIRAALARSNGNKSEAARQLGISRSNLIAKAKSYGLG